MNGILFQDAIGPASTKLTDLTEKWHAEVCAEFEWTHIVNHDRVIGEDRPLVWNKIMFLIKLLAAWPSVPLVAIMDADAMLIKKRLIAEALPNDFDLSLIKTNYCNSGFVIMRNTEEIRNFWRMVWEAGPMPKSTNKLVDSRLFEMLNPQTRKLKFYPMHSEWNWFDHYGDGMREVDCPRSQATVVAWHGQDKEYVAKEMKRQLERV